MKKNKYLYLRVLQEWTGEEWADSALYEKDKEEDRKELKADLKSYRENGVRVRVIDRRVLNEGQRLELYL